jgi:hypothetical protein
MAHLFDQPNINETVTWQPESNLRGTFSIISTCTVTITLGVWSVVHLNLPRIAWADAFTRRLVWAICSVLVPEASVIIAWSQHKAASRVQRKVEEVFGTHMGVSVSLNTSQWKAQFLMNTKDNVESNPPTRKNKWTMTHSYWAIMGGIALDVNGSEPFYPTYRPPTITENGILLLIKTDPDLLPDIPESDIRGISKYDSLFRLVTSIQAAWFCVSCLVRIGQQLPLSLLELTTAIHAVCTIITYFIWWRKPLGVKRQLFITSDRIRPLLAYMWMASQTSARPYTAEDLEDKDHTHLYSPAPEFEAITLGVLCGDGEADSRGSSQSALGRDESTTNTVTPKLGLVNTNFFVNESSARWIVKVTTITNGEDGPPPETTSRSDPAVFNLSATDARRWRLAYEALVKYALKKPTVDHAYVTTVAIPEMFDSPSEWTESDDMAHIKSLFAILGLCVLASGTGAGYALAWNVRFPSRSQRILWRVSSLIVACSAGVTLIFVIYLIISNLLWFVLEKRRTKRVSVSQPTEMEIRFGSTGFPELQRRRTRKRLAFFGKSLLKRSTWRIVILIMKGLAKLAKTLLLYSISALYPAARAYLFGESFRMVFYLPPKTFRATQWEKYFPHIG